MRSLRLKMTEINSSSMADIAFLLLIFFLVYNYHSVKQGIVRYLHPHMDDPPKMKFYTRNLYKIHINSSDRILVED